MAGLGVPVFPAANSSQVVLNDRKKVALKPGHSLMDWLRFSRTLPNLSGAAGRLEEINMDELALHNSEDDCWLAIKGKVYNVGPYMDFHPGGTEELMRGAGKDASKLFDEVHKWVNYESMLEKCYVGKLKASPRVSRTSLHKGAATNKIDLPPPKPTDDTNTPRFDWFQTATSVTMTIYTKCKTLESEHVIIVKQQKTLNVFVYIDTYMYQFHQELKNETEDIYAVKVTQGKVDITLTKVEEGKSWLALGFPLKNHNTFVKTATKESYFHACRVTSSQPVSHDTRLLSVRLPTGSRMCVPLGHHVYIKSCIGDIEVSKAYTAVLPSLQEGHQDEDMALGHVIYLMIKIYPDGSLTPFIGQLKEGDKILVSNYEGSFLASLLQQCGDIIMCAAGTGLTPMLRIIYQTVVRERLKHRKVVLMFFNKDERDILWKREFQHLSTFDGFEMYNILSEPHSDWCGLTGRIRKEILQPVLPTPPWNSLPILFACGPIPFTTEALRLAKEEFGYTDEMIHAFLG